MCGGANRDRLDPLEIRKSHFSPAAREIAALPAVFRLARMP
jgi:hypothetical protein